MKEVDEMEQNERIYIPKKYKRGTPREKEGGGKRPDLRISQVNYDQDGEESWMSVGGIWKNVSEKGKEYLNVKIGNLKLVGFPVDAESDSGKKLPAYHVCMKSKDEEGKVKTLQVGALWENKTKEGKRYFTLTMGDLRLPVFENENDS